MKKKFINWLVKIAIKLNKVQINAHDKIEKNNKKCIDEINRMVASGEYKYVRMTDPNDRKRICLTLKKV